jgi:GT2 family glycosyltransferase
MKHREHPPDEWPPVAVLILNWNHKDHVLALLRSLRETTYPKDRMGIFLCDNASTDGSAKALPAALEAMRSDGWRNVVYISNPDNLGFSGGNNRALRQVP